MPSAASLASSYARPARTSNVNISTTPVRLFATNNPDRVGYRFYNHTSAQIFVLELPAGSATPTLGTMTAAPSLPPVNAGGYHETKAQGSVDVWVCVAAGNVTLNTAEELVS